MEDIFSSKYDFKLSSPINSTLNDGIYRVSDVDVGKNSMFDVQNAINSDLYKSVVFEVFNQLNPSGSVKGFNVVGRNRNGAGLAILLGLINLSKANAYDYLEDSLVIVSGNSDLSGNYEQNNSGLWVKSSTGDYNYRTISNINSDYKL